MTLFSESDLSRIYEEGGNYYADEDYQRAAESFHKAAEQGYVKAQIEMAGMHFGGKGVEKSESQASYWLHKAAMQGEAMAQWFLGLIAMGEGNYADAIHWYGKAAEQGYEQAIEDLGWLTESGLI